MLVGLSLVLYGGCEWTKRQVRKRESEVAPEAPGPSTVSPNPANSAVTLSQVQGKALYTDDLISSSGNWRRKSCYYPDFRDQKGSADPVKKWQIEDPSPGSLNLAPLCLHH